MTLPDNNPKTAFGMKKTRMGLVPTEAIRHTAKAMTNGADKYGAYNWRNENISMSVYYDACLRHLTAWWDGEEKDKDSGCSHLGHAMACIAIILDGKHYKVIRDDRPKKGCKNDKAKTGDHVRSMDGIKEGYISATNGTHADVVWIDGTVSDKPIFSTATSKR